VSLNNSQNVTTRVKPFLYNFALPWLLVMIGVLQMVGFVTQLRPLQHLGSLLVASPLPFVFTSVRGYENFASHYTFDFKLENAQHVRFLLTPEVYNRLSGPYGRRAPYVHVLFLSPCPRFPCGNYGAGQ